MSLYLPTYYIDVATGELRASLGGPIAPPLFATQGDIISLPFGFCEYDQNKGNTVTSNGTATIYTSVKAAPGGTLLANGTTYTFSGGIATCALSLNTTQLDDYFDDNVPGQDARFWLEVRVMLSGQQRAYFLAPITIRRKILGTADAPTTAGTDLFPLAAQTAQFRSDVLHMGDLKALATATSTGGLPTGKLIWYYDATANAIGSGDLTGALVAFQLVSGTSTESSPWVLRPNDYHGTTNPKNFRLRAVIKAGSAALWNDTTSLFHGLTATGGVGSVSLAPDQTGFALTA